MTDVRDRLGVFVPSEQTFLGYLFWLSRPRFWLYLAGPVIVGVTYGAATPTELFQPLSIALFAYFLLPANIFLYGINDLFDADIDEHNPKKSDEGRELQYRGTRSVTVTVIASGLLGLVFVPFLPVEAIAGLVGFLLLGTAYSAPPARLKTTPFLDSLSNGLYVLPALVAYGAVTGAMLPVRALAGGWLWAMAMHTFSAIPDIEPDREAGIQTTATVLGQRPTLGYCATGWLLATLLLASVHPFLGAIFGIYPIFVLVIDLAEIDIDRAYWWFPFVNTLAGMILTLGGLWRVLHG